MPLDQVKNFWSIKFHQTLSILSFASSIKLLSSSIEFYQVQSIFIKFYQDLSCSIMFYQFYHWRVLSKFYQVISSFIKFYHVLSQKSFIIAIPLGQDQKLCLRGYSGTIELIFRKKNHISISYRQPEGVFLMSLNGMEYYKFQSKVLTKIQLKLKNFKSNIFFSASSLSFTPFSSKTGSNFIA